MSAAAGPDTPGFAAIAELALDLRPSWNHVSDQIWRDLDPILWELTQNPWLVLQTVPRNTLRSRLADPAFQGLIENLRSERREESEADAWFQLTHPQSALTGVAYFSMEFMLSEALPIYSGGLGNVAGDQLKAASDLGVPVVGVGLLYARGYFRQLIDKEGAQQALYPYNDPGQLPVKPLLNADGDVLRLEIKLPGYSIWVRTWQVQVGRIKLYLLDSNDAANFPIHRGLTSELYGGSPEVRLQQEMLLGIGGWRLLRTLGLDPQMCHLNEGHAAFAVLERARDYMESTHVSFAEALAITRAGNLFTTHTAVAAGFDRYAPAVIEQYMSHYAKDRLKISIQELLAFGRSNPADDSEPFNMAYLAVRGSGAVNGVSQLHGRVSQKLFEPLFPRWPEKDVPVSAVTNGIHTPTWDSAAADALWTEACGKERWQGAPDRPERGLRRVPDQRLWEFRSEARRGLVEFARGRAVAELAISGASPETVEAARQWFTADALTLGFARRFATYKRPNLLLHDPERLLRLLKHAERPVQLVIAGKAHPADQGGQALIKEWTQFARRDDVRSHVIFLGDYDMRLTQELVQGVDVWVNTPRRPWEACGTSGMKVLVNGGINLSELDGWWAEAYRPEIGWALGDGLEHGNDLARDAEEALALYEILERQVVPEFYERNAQGIPSAWIARMRGSMEQLTPQFSADRTVREYTERFYLPGARAYRSRSADQGAVGRQVRAWQDRVANGWRELRFGEVRVRGGGGEQSHEFEAELILGGSTLDAASVRVEFFANARAEGGEPERHEATPVAPGAARGMVTYRANVPANRPANDFTARALPRYDGVAVPLECNYILWQR